MLKILFIKDRTIKILTFLLMSLVTMVSQASGHAAISLGGFSVSEGKSQNINIQGLIGDHYTVKDHHDQNALIGLGYFIDGLEKNIFTISYGLNAFYLPKTLVKGTIVQEHLFSNLAYSYHISNLPIYAVGKTQINNSSNKYAINIDVGIGPNFIKTSHYHETPLDSGITLPDNAFAGHKRTVFSAMGGIGIQFNNIYANIPVELDYRIFYLGQGNLDKQSNQLLNTLKTGTSYAQALVLSVIL